MLLIHEVAGPKSKLQYVALNGSPKNFTIYGTNELAQADMQGVPAYYVDEFRSSMMCNQCHQPCVVNKRSLHCPTHLCGGPHPEEYDKKHRLDKDLGLSLDHDHNAGSNMAKVTQQWLTTFKWPEALDHKMLTMRCLP